MRQAVLILLATALGVCVGCGGSKSSTSSTSTGSIQISPSTLSLNQGDVLAFSGTVLDANGATATNPKAIVWSTSNAAIATVTSDTGSVCGGVWDANHIVCAAGQVGTATITATSGGLTATATVFVHKKVDRVVISTPTGACKSVGQTLQLSATAFNNGADVTSTVGPITWTAKTPAVATIDTNGILTAAAPGQSSIIANVSNVTSVPVTYTTCAVKSIHVHVTGAADTSFTIATSATQSLTADVVDTAGNTITPSLTWASNHPGIVGASAPAGTTGTSSSSQIATANTPGTASIVAECAITCNYNLPPVYSDVIVANVSGSNATTAYVTGTGTTSLVPIDTGTNTAGTAITLPDKPNSLVFGPVSSTAYLGSATGLITLITSTNTVSQNTAFPGKVLAVSPDGTRVIVADTSLVYGVSVAGSNGNSESLGIAGATAAAFAPDSTRAYIVAGTNLYVYTPGSPTGTLTLTGSATDIAMSPSAAFVYIANGVPNAITTRATCDLSASGTFATAGAPAKLAITPDAAKIIAVDSPNIDVLTRTSLAQPGCPPPLSATVSTVNLGQGAFTLNQFVLTTSGAKAYIVSNLPNVIVYDIAAATPSAIALANGATGLSASATQDGTKLYVGGSDNNVHRIDTAAGTDAQQISVSFTPNLVAVAPK